MTAFSVAKWTVFAPIYIPYSLTLKPLFWLAHKVLGLPLWAVRKINPQSKVGKFLCWLVVVWCYIPFAKEVTLLWVASKLGYEHQVHALFDWCQTAGGMLWETAKVSAEASYHVLKMAAVMLSA